MKGLKLTNLYTPASILPDELSEKIIMDAAYDEYEQRAAILQFDAGLPREEAEAMAVH